MQSKFRRRGIGAAIEGPLVRQGLMALSQRQHGALWVVLSIAEAKMKELSVFAIQKARGGGVFLQGKATALTPCFNVFVALRSVPNPYVFYII